LFAGAVIETVGGVLSVVFVVPKVKPLAVTGFPPLSTDCTLKKYSVLGESPEMVCEWVVDIVPFFVVEEPRLDVVPYITCEVPGVLVDQETVAEVVVMPPAATFEMIRLLPLPLAAVRRRVCASML